VRNVDASNEDRHSVSLISTDRWAGSCHRNHGPIQSELFGVVEIAVEGLISEKVRVGDWPLGDWTAPL
jgi:hypothetical protein